MRRIILATLLALNLVVSAQTNLIGLPKETTNNEEQTGIITGHLTTAANEPAAYVSIGAKGTKTFTTTDENGYFILRGLKEGTYVLEISMVGAKGFERTVDVKKESIATVDIVLSEDAKQLSEIIVSSGRRLNSRPVAIGKVPIPPMDLPQAVTVIGQGMIREQQALRLSDVIKNVNGIYLPSTRGSALESFAGRGYTFGSNNLFKNGARINTGSMPEMSGPRKSGSIERQRRYFIRASGAGRHH